jgi:PAS domain S-box-containing protein
MGILAKLLSPALRRWLLASLGGPREDRFSRVFHASPDWVVITRISDGLILEANQGFHTISGYSPAEVIGRPISDFNVWVNPQQRGVLVEELNRAGLVRDTRVQLRRRDGAVRDCMVNCAFIALDGETNSHAVWIARDVTDQNAVYEQFTAAFRLTPDSMSISRLSDGRYVEVNAAFEALTGLSREQAIGKTTLELGVWADPEQRDVLVATIQTQRSVKDFFMRIKSRDGPIREVRLSAAAFETRGERYMFVLLRDVTDSQTAARALRDSEARFSALFHNSLVPQVVSNRLTRVIEDVNEAFVRLTGHPREHLLGTDGMDPDLLWDEDARRIVRAAHAQGETRGGVDIRLRRADGELRTVLGSAFVISTAAGPRIAWSLNDVTDQRAAQQQMRELNQILERSVQQRTEQLTRSNAELQTALKDLDTSREALLHAEKLAALGRIVAGVAHELNTPIGNSLLSATTLTHHTKEFAREVSHGLRRSTLINFLALAQEASAILQRNLERADELIRSFKQVATDQTSSQRRVFVLKDVVSEVMLSLRPTLKSSPIAIEVDVPASIELDSYPGPLGQVVANLVNNAVLHGYEGYANGVITITARTDDVGQVVLRSLDHGRGIAQDDLSRVFDPFFTTRLGKGGSGLGLNVVHNIVTQLLGGTIGVESEPGKGACFTVTIPLVAPVRDTVASA